MQRTQSGAEPRIAILGAGPSGLLTAHYLRKNGYQNVTVLEKLGRVGGLACTITYQGRSFDLGANYVTPAYREILALARELGATLYTERPFVAMRVPPTGRVSYESLFRAMLVDAETGKPIPLPTLLRALAKFCWLRFGLRRVIDAPTFAGVERRPDVCVTFLEWLRANGIDCLHTIFQLPIDLMGYGTVTTTPAIYALKFMTLATFVPMLMKETPWIGRWMPWPKRFTDGYQRLFERLAWGLDVRLGVHVDRIERKDGRVVLHYRAPEQVLDATRWASGELAVDRLILACPLTADVLPKLLEPTEFERELVASVRKLSYCMTTFEVEGLEIGAGAGGAGPLAAAFPVPPIGTPWGVAKQWRDCDFVQFYTRVDPKREYDPVKREVVRDVRRLVDQMGGRIVGDDLGWHTYDQWPYFQHVELDAIRGGFYSRLEQHQGDCGTYYVGGATNFELIEPIAEYAKHLVAAHFPAR
jgi:hypothetical protein